MWRTLIVESLIIVILCSDEQQVVVSSSDPVCPVGYINFTKLHLQEKVPVDLNEIVIRNSIDFISDLNESSYNDLSDPDLTGTELEFIEKENSAKTLSSQNQMGAPVSHRGSFSRSQSLSITKNSSLEVDIDELKFEFESKSLQNRPNIVSNKKGWYWISGIQGNIQIKTLKQ